MKIRNINVKDREWAEQFITKEWGSVKIVSKGAVYDVLKLKGFVAEENHKPAGILTYNVYNNECEIITLNTVKSNKGIGNKLLQALFIRAKENKWKRIWAITTNDNLTALLFYQKKGFIIKSIYSNAIAKSRKLKPSIPFIGKNNIPIRDEIELEIIF